MSEAVKELIDIVIKLRSDNGCDWDRKQTSESLTPHLIEEASEVVDAVLEKNSENLYHLNINNKNILFDKN